MLVIPSKSSSSATPTASRTRPRKRSPARRPTPTIRSSSTAASGLGKTHLMHAIGHRVIQRQPERQRRLRHVREVHQRVHHRAPEQSHARVSQPLPPGRRAADRRHSVPGRQRDDARRVLPHLQRAARVGAAARDLVATVRRKRFRRSKRGCARVSSGACSPTFSRPTSRRAKRFFARRPSSEKIPGARRGDVVHRQGHPLEHPRARRRADSRRRLCLADEVADHDRPRRRSPQERASRRRRCTASRSQDQRDGRRAHTAYRQGDGQRPARSAPRRAAPDRDVHRDRADRITPCRRSRASSARKTTPRSCTRATRSRSRCSGDEAYRNKIRQLIALCQTRLNTLFTRSSLPRRIHRSRNPAMWKRCISSYSSCSQVYP